MADRARIDSPHNKPELAKNLHPDEVEGHTFYCATDGCSARMFPYAIGTPRARFSSFHISDHISSKCIGRELIYDPHKYVEDLFMRDSFFDFSQANNHKSDPPFVPVHNDSAIQIHNAPRTAVNTVLGLYTIFANKGTLAQYNCYTINDMFACIDNAREKADGFTGGVLAEGTFYRYDQTDNSLILNFPRLYKKVGELKLHFSQNVNVKEYVMKHFRRRINTGESSFDHSRLLVVAGMWQVSQNPNIIAECKIYTLRQIAFIDPKY